MPMPGDCVHALEGDDVPGEGQQVAPEAVLGEEVLPVGRIRDAQRGLESGQPIGLGSDSAHPLPDSTFTRAAVSKCVSARRWSVHKNENTVLSGDMASGKVAA